MLLWIIILIKINEKKIDLRPKTESTNDIQHRNWVTLQNQLLKTYLLETRNGAALPYQFIPPTPIIICQTAVEGNISGSPRGEYLLMMTFISGAQRPLPTCIKTL